MSSAASPPIAAGANPFNPKVVLGMVVFGFAVFIALLWMIGAGMTDRSANNGEAHVGSKGLTGYAALAGILEKQGNVVRRVRAIPLLKDPGLLVLTPPLYTEGKEIAKIIADRRYIGPTMLVLPKWESYLANAMQAESKDGWVLINGMHMPEWLKDLGTYKIETKQIGDEKDKRRIAWDGLGHTGFLPDPREQVVVSDFIGPLVKDSEGNVLAGYWNDYGVYPKLAEKAGWSVTEAGKDENGEAIEPDKGLFPLIIVAEPDLLDNWGTSDEGRTRVAVDLMRLAAGQDHGAINFDLTLNGFKRSANLLTLAFKPPFLAATLCLLIAALVAGWRAFLRFGPALAEERAIAFGKTALVANSAGLVRRSGRLHLLGAPYAALLRERLAHRLALPRGTDPALTEAAIDRAQAARDPQTKPFSRVAADLRAARKATDLLRAGQALKEIERMLTR